MAGVVAEMKFPALVPLLVISLLILAGSVGLAYARSPELLNGPSNNRFEGDPTGGVFGVLDGGTAGGGASNPPVVPPSESGQDIHPVKPGIASDAAVSVSALVPIGLFLTSEYRYFIYGVYR